MKRYFVTTVICAALAFIGAVLWTAAMLPAGEGSFGVAKAVPLIIPFFTVLLFGAVWFPITLVVFLRDRFKRNSSQPSSVFPQAVVLVVAALAFVPSAPGLFSIWREESHSSQLASLASNPTVHSQELVSAIDSYCADSHRGLSETRDTKVMEQLSRNRSAPAEVLERLADGLDDRSALLSGIAENPNSSPRLLARFRSVPSVASYLPRNPQAPPELLADLSSSTDDTVRVFVARNLRTPRAVIARLTKDSNDLVRHYAKDNLNGTLGDFAVR